MIDVVEVEFDPALQLSGRARRAARTIDLRPSGEARLDAMTMRIAIGDLGSHSIFRTHVDRVRTRSDQRHLALEHIEELRQLIQTESAEPTADGSDAWIVALGLLERGSASR